MNPISQSDTKLHRAYLLVPVILLALLPLNGCKKKAYAAAPVANPNPDQIEVPTELAASLKLGNPVMRDVNGMLQVSAHVETDASRIARVGSPVSGRILRLLVFEGQVVHSGSVLATLHSTELSAAQMELIKASSEENLAAAATRRAEQLVAHDVIGRAELERRQAELLQASTTAASYRTQLRGLGMTEAHLEKLLKTHELSADYAIVAPRSGTVLERKVTIGQVVQPADPAFMIADLSSVWIVANVPEEEAGQLKKGLQVTVEVPALGNRKIPGHLSYVAPIVDPATRTIQVRMEIANPDGMYKPDQLASMTFSGRTEQKLTIPQTAIIRQENKDFVFVQVNPSTFKLREVTTGQEVDDRRVLLSGLAPDETVVTDGAFHLNNQRKQDAIKGGK